jgi:hypothetical protein
MQLITGTVIIDWRTLVSAGTVRLWGRLGCKAEKVRNVLGLAAAISLPGLVLLSPGLSKSLERAEQLSITASSENETGQ